MSRDDSSYRTNQVSLIVRCCDVAREPVDTPLSLKDCLIDFLNFAGGAFTDAFEASQTGSGVITIQSMADVEPVAFTDPRKESETSSGRPYCLMTRRVVVAITGGGGQQ